MNTPIEKTINRRTLFRGAALSVPAVVVGGSVASAATVVLTPGEWTKVNWGIARDDITTDSPTAGGAIFASDGAADGGQNIIRLSKALHLTPGTRYRFTFDVRARRAGADSPAANLDVYLANSQQPVVSVFTRQPADREPVDLLQSGRTVGAWGAAKRFVHEFTADNAVPPTIDYRFRPNYPMQTVPGGLCDDIEVRVTAETV